MSISKEGVEMKEYVKEGSSKCSNERLDRGEFNSLKNDKLKRPRVQRKK